MKLSNSMKKFFAYVCAIAMVVSSITFYGQTSVKAKGSVAVDGKVYTVTDGDATIVGFTCQGIFDKARIHFAWGTEVDAASITTTVDGKTVRILGFNHDTLTDTNAYGTKTETGKAGISFEYVDFVTSNSQMNASGRNYNGWAAMPLRTTLNGTVYDSLSIKNYIKAVNKEYITTYNTGAKSTCSDKLWLLSCGEIWDNGYNGGNTRGYAAATEGSQYKYYKTNLGSTSYGNTTNVIKKPNASNSYYWWLRSPGYSGSNRFCLVDSGGYCSHNDASNDYGVAPGFSI